MEGGSSSSAGDSGGGDLGAAQEPREEDRVGRRRSCGGGMRARVCARVRTPQGVGPLLVVGGVIIGAAVVAWRRRHHARRRDDDGDGKGCKNHHREQPAKAEVLDGRVVEDEQQGKFDQSGENLSRDDTVVGANGLDGKATEELYQIQNGKATKELHEIQEEDEIVTDESGDGPVEKFDENSSKKCVDIIADDMESENVKKVDENSNNSDIDSEITTNATEDLENLENSDQSTLSISSQEISHEEHNEYSGGAQDIASTQNTTTKQMMMHQQQILEDQKSDTVTETAEAELIEGAAMKKNVSEQEEQKPLAEPVELIGSPAISSLPSLLKLAEKKGPAYRRRNETRLKLDQDCTNFELSKGRATQGVAVVTMDRRTASMAILALIFAVTIGVNIVMRLYSSFKQHDLQMNLR